MQERNVRTVELLTGSFAKVAFQTGINHLYYNFTGLGWDLHVSLDDYFQLHLRQSYCGCTYQQFLCESRHKITTMHYMPSSVFFIMLYKLLGSCSQTWSLTEFPPEPEAPITLFNFTFLTESHEGRKHVDTIARNWVSRLVTIGSLHIQPHPTKSNVFDVSASCELRKGVHSENNLEYRVKCYRLWGRNLRSGKKRGKPYKQRLML